MQHLSGFPAACKKSRVGGRLCQTAEVRVRLKKLLLSLFVLLGSGAYVWADRGWVAARDEADAKLAEADETTKPDSSAPAPTTGTATLPAVPGHPGVMSSPDDAIAALDQHTASLASAPTATGALHDGQYFGPQIDAYYGYVEVFIEVVGGQINSVRAQHVPRSSPTSRFLNSKAVPKLNKQVIRTQGAAVDVITGATLTSKAYAISLAGALQQARQ